MNSKFIKTYSIEGQLSTLPDSDYWLSREESILTYLHQRGASVPKVQMKDLMRKSLTLQNVGTSLDVFFNGKDHAVIYTNSALQLYLSTIILLEELLSLGVLHLDIALRNVATPSLNQQEIYILDFIHALTSYSTLQKPLPLLPTEGLHHPVLIQALNTDWENYFKFFNKETPKLDKTLSISNEEYCEYWIDLPSVQKLCEHHPILSHGLNNFASEIANSKNVDDSAREIFTGFSEALRNLDNKESYLKLAEIKGYIASIVGADSSHGYRHINATPIPKVHRSNVEISKPVPSDAIKPTTTLVPRGQVSYGVIAEKEDDLPFLIKEEWSKTPKLNSSFSAGNFLLCWGLILVNLYLIDFVVRNKRIILADEIILLVILVGAIAPITVVIGLFLRGIKRTKILSFSALLAVAAELIVIGSYPTSTYSSFLLWLPSCAIAFFAFILSISNKRAENQA